MIFCCLSIVLHSPGSQPESEYSEWLTDTDRHCHHWVRQSFLILNHIIGNCSCEQLFQHLFLKVWFMITLLTLVITIWDKSYRNITERYDHHEYDMACSRIFSSVLWVATDSCTSKTRFQKNGTSQLVFQKFPQPSSMLCKPRVGMSAP